MPHLQAAQRQARGGGVSPSRVGPGASRADLQGGRALPGPQRRAPKTAAPVCRRRAQRRRRRPCTRRRAHTEWGPRPACPPARADWRSRPRGAAGRGRHWRGLPVTQLAGEGGASSRRDTTKRLFQGRQAPSWLPVYSLFAAWGSTVVRAHGCKVREAATCFHTFGWADLGVSCLRLVTDLSGNSVAKKQFLLSSVCILHCWGSQQTL